METDTPFGVLNSQQVEKCSTASRNPRDHEEIDIDPRNTDPEETNENDQVVEINDEDTGFIIR